eukprot:730635-Amphidinium_carterae.1
MQLRTTRSAIQGGLQNETLTKCAKLWGMAFKHAMQYAPIEKPTSVSPREGRLWNMQPSVSTRLEQLN